MSEIRSQATHELVVPIHEHVCAANLEDCTGECYLAAAALQNDGWSKPRTVNSATELHTLPVESVVRNRDGWIGEISIVSGKPVIFWIGNECEDELKDITLPATVLFTPGDAGHE